MRSLKPVWKLSTPLPAHLHPKSLRLPTSATSQEAATPLDPHVTARAHHPSVHRETEVDGIAAASAPPDSSRSTTATFRLAAQDQHVLLLQQQLQALQTTLAEVLDDRSDRRRRSPKASRSGSSNPGSASREAPAGLAPPRAATGRRRMCVPRQRTRQRAFGTEHLSPAVPDALAGLLL